MIALRKPQRMSVEEFQNWEPPHNADRRWHLVDGVAVCMSPASDNHGRILAETTFLLTAHLRATRPGCNVVVAPGIIPPVRSTTNERIPDLGVTCAPPSGAKIMTDPLLLIEVLSPSNENMTRANVWAYLTIPSVTEILLLGSVAIEAELMRRDANGLWPETPVFLPADDELELASIGFRTPLRSLYRTTNL
jgi:Uma2 family endonuclease